MSRVVYLHVGAPKTGTTYLQDRLALNRGELRQHGVHYPIGLHSTHFRAALDLVGMGWGGIGAEVGGEWDRLVRRVRRHSGTVLISHEILASAKPKQIRRVMDDLAGDEVHVVYSARDLARQIPAEWQEGVKHRRGRSFSSFLKSVQSTRRNRSTLWFWRVQGLPDVLSRWSRGLPPERVHLVTVPPAGSPKDLLWQRFSRVLGLDPAEFTLDGVRTNPSLGVAEVAVVRHLNEQVAEVLPNHHYRAIVREALVHRNLSGDRRSARLSVPPDVWEWAAALSRQWVAELTPRGYDVVGDLDDLLPAPPLPWVDPDQPEIEQLADATSRALTAMTVEAARLRDREVELQHDIAELIEKLDRAHSTPIYKAKERFVARAGSSRLAARLLAAYRRLRGRNSRST
jgi:hypothetical protein